MPHNRRPFIFCRLDLAESQDVRKFRDHPPWLQDLTNPLGSVLTKALRAYHPAWYHVTLFQPPLRSDSRVLAAVPLYTRETVQGAQPQNGWRFDRSWEGGIHCLQL